MASLNGDFPQELESFISGAAEIADRIARAERKVASANFMTMSMGELAASSIVDEAALRVASGQSLVDLAHELPGALETLAC